MLKIDSWGQFHKTKPDNMEKRFSLSLEQFYNVEFSTEFLPLDPLVSGKLVLQYTLFHVNFQDYATELIVFNYLSSELLPHDIDPWPCSSCPSTCDNVGDRSALVGEAVASGNGEGVVIGRT